MYKGRSSEMSSESTYYPEPAGSGVKVINSIYRRFITHAINL
jgi:hypothetical protein